MKKIGFLFITIFIGLTAGCATTQNYTRQEAEGVPQTVQNSAEQVSDMPIPECQYLMRNLLVPWSKREYWCDTDGRNSKRTYYINGGDRQAIDDKNKNQIKRDSSAQSREKNLVLHDEEGRKLYYSVAYSTGSEPNFDSLWKLIKKNNPEGKNGDKFLIYTGLYKANVLK